MNLIAKIKTLWLRIKESLISKKRQTKDPFGNPNLTHEIDRIIVRKNGIF